MIVNPHTSLTGRLEVQEMLLLLIHHQLLTSQQFYTGHLIFE